MRTASVAIAAAVVHLFVVRAGAQIGELPCVETERPDPQRPDLVLERAAFGFHDEEVVICSPGFEQPTHLTARLWVPAKCVTEACPGLLISHGFGFAKEVTFADMQNAVGRGLIVLSYDVRGQGTSGGQVGLMGREEIADQATILTWFHHHVAPTKVGVYGISQGGANALMAAIFNCGRDRAASFDSSIPCDQGGRLVDAIVPVQAPTRLAPDDGVCSIFALQAIPESRFNLALAREGARCVTRGTPLEEATIDATEPLPAYDFEVSNYLRADRVARIDVPVYLVTSFFDRLVLPQNTTILYERLRERVNDPGDPYVEDLRLLISNDGHGSVGGNFAVLNDVFTWLARVLGADSTALDEAPLRTAPVAIAQEWAGNAFRLENEWPIPATEATYFLSRSMSDEEANGRLVSAPGSGDAEAADEMRNLPFVSSPPGLFFTESVNPANTLTGSRGIPLVRLVYLTEPMSETQTMEITGLPRVTLRVSSDAGNGQGQFHVSLAEVSPQSEVTEFARNRRGTVDLGTTPAPIELALTVSSHRIDPGNRLMLTITASDAAEVVPFVSPNAIFVHHDAANPSLLVVPTVSIDREQPTGSVPSGAGFTEDPLGTICEAFGQDCGQ